MPRNRRVAMSVLTAGIVLGLAIFSSAKGSSKPISPPTYNVTSTLYDYTDSSLTQEVLLRSDDPHAGFASYSASDSAVSSTVGGFTNEWELNLSQQTARQVWVTLSSTVSGPNSPIPDGLYNATIFSRCYDQNLNDTGWLAIASGSTNHLCSLRVNLLYNSTSYTFVMGPNFSGTGWASVTCNAANAAGCTSWTVVPTPGSVTNVGNLTNNATVANLYTSARGGKEILIGSYNNTYRIMVTIP